jgi:hypothetical protein
MKPRPIKIVTEISNWPNAALPWEVRYEVTIGHYEYTHFENFATYEEVVAATMIEIIRERKP